MNWLFGGLVGALGTTVVIVLVMMLNKWQENWILIPGLVLIAVSASVGCLIGGLTGIWILGLSAPPITILLLVGLATVRQRR